MEIRTKLITDLPLSEVLGGVEIFPVSQFGIAKKASTQDIINFTKKQEYATWVNKASTNLETIDLSTRYIKLLNSPQNEGPFPEFFIGEAGYYSSNGEVSGLSGFQFHFNENTDRFVFVSYISSVSSVKNLTAYYIDPNAYMYITNLSTSNTLSAKNIYVTDQIILSANTNDDAFLIIQNGQGNAFEVFDEINDTTPFVITASGNVGIKTPNPIIDLTIAGSVSASQTLSARNINVLDRVGIGTSNPNETLTVSGNISARSVIFDGRLNSNRWFETYTNYSAASANEARVATFVNSNSSNINNVNTTVNNTSANWNSVYSHWNVNSGLTFATRTYVNNNSANFSDSITRYNTASATYATYEYTNKGFLPLSGGEVSSGVVRISGSTTFGSDVTIVGRLCAFNFTVIQAETIPITAATLNVDGSGRFGGAFQVGGEVLFSDDLIVTGFANVSSTITADNIITSRQYLQDLNSNSREWGSVYNRWRAVSALDLDVRTFTNSNSSNIRNVNTTVNNTSANWNSVYSSWNSNSSLDLNARTFVNSNSSNIVNVNTKVNAASSIWDRASTVTSETSANWNSVYSSWKSNSSLDLNARTFVNSNSSNIVNVNTKVNTTSANWDSVYSSWNSNSASSLEAETFVQNNSSNIRNVNTTVNNTSANWNSVYSHWNVNSGLTFSARTFVTSNSSNIINVNTKVNSASANWDSVYGSFFSLSATIGEGLTEFQESSARYNRVSTRMEVTSANWNSVYSTFQANSAKYNSTRGIISIPSAGTTNITVPDHAVGFMDIYLNGIKLVPTDDFTETATTITLTEPTKYANYKLEYVVYGSYNVPNVVAKTGDVMTGPLTVPSITVNNSFATKGLVLDRQDTNAEGGELILNRSSDNNPKYYIDVFGTGDDPELRIFEKVGTVSPTYPVRMVIQGGSGNIGIGTSAPDTGKVYIYQNSTDDYGLIILTDTANTAGALLIDNRSNSAGATVINSGSSTAFTVSQRGTGYSMIVEDQESDTSPSLTIDNDGNIGMGTYVLDGNTRLEIKGKQSVPSASPDVRISSTNGGTLMVLDNAQVGNYGPLTQANDILVSYYGSGGVNTGGFTLAQWATSSKGIRITPAGNVGINTPNANQALTVSGSISATGNIVITGTFEGDGSKLTNLNQSKKFYSFKSDENNAGYGSYYRVSSFLSADRRLYFAGYAEGYKLGMGNNRNYADEGFRETNLFGNGGQFPWSSGEIIEKYYMSRSMVYVLTNYGNLYSMGYNGYGQLGHGDTTNREYLFKLNTIGNVTYFSAGNGSTTYQHCFAINNQGRLFAWGYNGYGNLGLGDTTNRNVPTQVNGGSIAGRTIVKAYAIGDSYTSYCHSFVIDSDRNVHACGSNGAGHLGLGDTTQRNVFVQIPGIKADKLWSEDYNNSGATFILDGTTLRACGYNSYGQLGDGTVTTRPSFTPVTVLGGAPVQNFHLGNHHGGCPIAILTDGTIRTWGWNGYGNVGNGSTTNLTNASYNPTYLALNSTWRRAIKVASCDHTYPTSYLLTSDGLIAAVGYNGYGQQLNGYTGNTNFWSWGIHPRGLKWVDFNPWGLGSFSGVTAVDEVGDLWSAGANDQDACGVPWRNNSHCYGWHKCTIN